MRQESCARGDAVWVAGRCWPSPLAVIELSRRNDPDDRRPAPNRSRSRASSRPVSTGWGGRRSKPAWCPGWVARVNLAKATDLLDDRYGLGEALGGMILLSVAGSLPELAITISAAVAGNMGMAAGNLIGGVAMQTFVLVIADRFVRGNRPLSTAAGSLVPALEGLLVIAVVCVTVMSAERRSPGSAARATSPSASSVVSTRVTVGRCTRSRAASSDGVSGPWRSIVASAAVSVGERPVPDSWRSRRAVRATAMRRWLASSTSVEVLRIAN